MLVSKCIFNPQTKNFKQISSFQIVSRSLYVRNVTYGLMIIVLGEESVVGIDRLRHISWNPTSNTT